MKRSGALIATAATFLLAAGGAFAAISVTTSPTSAAVTVTLNGDDQTPTFTETLTVSGQGSTGWNITAYAPAPTGAAGTLSPLAVTALPTATCSGKNCNVGTATTPVSGYTYPYSIGTTAGTATKIWNAASGTGNSGSQIVTVVFGAPVNANEFVGSYTTTLTVIVGTSP